MKPVLFFSLLIALASTTTIDREELSARTHEECMADPKTRVNETLLYKFPEDETLIVPNIEVHFLCHNIKMGHQSENGDIHKDAIRIDLENTFRNGDKITEIIDDCFTQANTREKPSDKAFKLNNCLRHYVEKETIEKKKRIDAYTEHRFNQFVNIEKECLAKPESALTVEENDELDHGHDLENPKFAANILCNFKGLEVIRKDGNPDLEQIENDLEMFGHNIYQRKNIIEECVPKSKIDEPLASAKLFRCLRKYFGSNGPTLFFREHLRTKQFQTTIKQCDSDPSSHASNELRNKLREGQYVDDAKLRANIFCINKGTGIQNETGDINKDVVKSDLQIKFQDESTIKKIVEECAVRGPKESPGETAVKLFICLHKNSDQKQQHHHH